MTSVEGARLDELAANLAAVRARVAAACSASDRRTEEVTVVAVSKTWPASDVLLLSTLGVADFGESYDQEAAAKAGALAAAAVHVRWHFVGRLQRNKCRPVARYADVVHSVDRRELVAALSAGARSAGRRLDVLVQVSLEPDQAGPDQAEPDQAGPGGGRGGADPAAVPALVDEVAAADGLTPRGVMAVAPLGVPAGVAFARLAAVAAAVRAAHPGADLVSAGMTGDLEEAVAAGATHVRVGTALFGPRARRG